MTIAAATLTMGAVLAPAASAEHVFFSIGIDGSGSAGVSFDDYTGTATRADLVRGGVVVGTATSGAPFAYIQTRNLQAGDVLNAYRGDVLVGSVPYNGQPAFGADACAGRSTFTVTYDADARIDDAGTYVPGSGGYGNWTRTIWSKTNPSTVTVDRPLVLGAVVWASTYRRTSWPSGRKLDVISQRDHSVQACPVPVLEEKPPAAAPPAPPSTPTFTPTTLEGAFRSLVATSFTKLDPAKLGRRTQLTVSFIFPEPGTFKLRLTTKAKGKTVVLGTGSKSAPAGKAKVNVKLTKAGRTLLKRSKKLKVTVAGTFTPSGAGAKPVTQRTTVTLARAAKKSK